MAKLKEVYEMSALRRGEKGPRTREVVLALLRQHERDDALPTNGRFVFYELEQVGKATKPLPGDTRPNRRRSIGWPPGSQDITDALTELSEAGVIPWSWIVDESRSISTWTDAVSVTEYLLERLEKGFRLRPWGDGLGPLVICEADATAGVLDRIARRYLVPITGTRGNANRFLRVEVAPVAFDRDVIYLGDEDFSGGHIERNTEAILRDEGWDGAWERIAMTQELARRFHIDPILKTDGRTKETYEAIEVESLGQARLERLLERELVARLPEPLEDVLKRQQEQEDAAARRLKRWKI
jgi:hypothetical protein